MLIRAKHALKLILIIVHHAFKIILMFQLLYKYYQIKLKHVSILVYLAILQMALNSQSNAIPVILNARFVQKLTLWMITKLVYFAHNSILFIIMITKHVGDLVLMELINVLLNHVVIVIRLVKLVNHKHLV